MMPTGSAPINNRKWNLGRLRGLRGLRGLGRLGDDSSNLYVMTPDGTMAASLDPSVTGWSVANLQTGQLYDTAGNPVSYGSSTGVAPGSLVIPPVNTSSIASSIQNLASSGSLVEIAAILIGGAFLLKALK